MLYYPASTLNGATEANIRLVYPAFNRPQRIDLLIGASILYDLLCVRQIKLFPGLPLLQKTRLGRWVVSGGGQRNLNTSTRFEANNDCKSFGRCTCLAETQHILPQELILRVLVE